MEELVCVKIKESADPLLDKVEVTYIKSFPQEERRAFSLVRDLIDSNPYFNVYVFIKGDDYVGFITIWQLDGFDYVEHFAIDPAARNGGIGGKALQSFLDFSEKPIVLEVESPEDEMSRRRIGFYERLGFILDDNHYLQPPYREGDSWLKMFLMSCGEIDLTTSFEKVRDSIYSHVYQQNLK